jgi:hypothetical protein
LWALVVLAAQPRRGLGQAATTLLLILQHLPAVVVVPAILILGATVLPVVQVVPETTAVLVPQVTRQQPLRLRETKVVMGLSLLELITTVAVVVELLRLEKTV